MHRNCRLWIVLTLEAIAKRELVFVFLSRSFLSQFKVIIYREKSAQIVKLPSKLFEI